jgi:hypothetical protein
MAKANAVFTAKTAAKANTILIRAGQTKHGPGRSKWGQHEYAMAAIGVLYPDGLPPSAASIRGFKSMLVRAVQRQLNKDSVYRKRGFTPVSRNTVLHAAGLTIPQIDN